MTPFIKTYDGRLKLNNYIFEMELSQYYNIIKNRLQENRYQRKRVKNSSSVYDLLKKDLIEGCIMPPIVLAIEDEIIDNKDIIEQLSSDKKILILDGLQRSFTIYDIFTQPASIFDAPHENQIGKNRIRIELYTKINRTALLYRMLTLNTGQTRMSTRHQIEIIYSDFLDSDILPHIKLHTDNEKFDSNMLGFYKFRDVVEGYTSFLMEDFLLLDRIDILNNIKELENLNNVAENQKDLFCEFIESYTQIISTINEHQGDFPQKLKTCIDEREDTNPMQSFGNNVINIFNKSQAITGFGYAVSKLINRGDIKNISDTQAIIQNININSVSDGLMHILLDLEKIRDYAKKIGNDQRYYFARFFQYLFDSDMETRDILKASEKTWEAYRRDFL